MNYTHTDWVEFKKSNGLNNAAIANILGMTTDSVKTLAAKNKELPKWAILAIFAWKNTQNKTAQ